MQSKFMLLQILSYSVYVINKKQIFKTILQSKNILLIDRI